MSSTDILSQLKQCMSINMNNDTQDFQEAPRALAKSHRLHCLKLAKNYHITSRHITDSQNPSPHMSPTAKNCDSHVMSHHVTSCDTTCPVMSLMAKNRHRTSRHIMSCHRWPKTFPYFAWRRWPFFPPHPPQREIISKPVNNYGLYLDQLPILQILLKPLYTNYMSGQLMINFVQSLSHLQLKMNLSIDIFV